MRVSHNEKCVLAIRAQRLACPGSANLPAIELELAGRLAECFRKEGILVTRDMIASIETHRCAVTDY
jgi:hypothetical protein